MSHQPELPPLTSHLGYWLRFVSNHVSHAFARKLEGQDVTVAEWVVLRALYGQEPLAPSRLAERLGLTRGAISKLADRLMEKNLIGRDACVHDLRAHTLALTPAGAALVPSLARLADENDAAFFMELSAEERALMARALKGIAARHSMKSIPIT